MHLLEDGTGFRIYNDLTEFVIGQLPSDESLLEYKFVLREMLTSSELYWVDGYVIEETCVEEFLQYYEHEISKDTLLILLATMNGIDRTIERSGRPTLEGLIDKFKKPLPDFLDDSEIDNKVIFLPKVIEAIGVTYTPESLHISQAKFEKLLDKMKAKYDVEVEESE